MKNLVETDFVQMLLLLRHCDNRKVHYRHKNNFIAEKLFSYLEVKIGMLVDHISMCLMEENRYGRKITQKYPEKSIDISLTEVKIKEIQTLIFTHYVSLMESSLREKIVGETGENEKILLNDILKHLHKKRKIDNNQLHLWTGMRHLRNAIVHYDTKPRVTLELKYEEDLVISLKKDTPRHTTDLYEGFRLMRWMTYNIEPLVQ